MIQRLLLNLVAALAISGMLLSSAFARTSGNLLVNGDGETGNCTADWNAVTTVPGWTVVKGSPTLLCYSIGGFTTPGSPAPGTAFIADGPYGDSGLVQTVDVRSAAKAIDRGGVTLNLSGWLGGRTIQSGRAQLTATFLDTRGHILGGPAQLAGVTASARGDKSGFLAESVGGAVPAHARYIDVALDFVDTAGASNVGYADNLSLTLSTPVKVRTLGAPISSVPAFDHVFMVMMENTDYAQVIGDTSNAPFINGLAARGTLLTNYNAVYHPSDENYLAIAGGAAFVRGAIYYPNIHVTFPHIGDAIEAIGKTWKVYEQGMGIPCNTSAKHEKYYDPDDAPFIDFTDIASNRTRCEAHLFDTTQLTTDLQSSATTPNFAWIAADDYDDGEASGNGSAASLRVQDAWLRQTLEPIFDSPAWQTQRSLLILTWDESSARATNHVATILVGSQGLVRSGILGHTSYNHYSTGRTIERALGLAPLTANDANAQTLDDAFVASTPAPRASLTTSIPSVSQGSNIVFNYASPPAMLRSDNWIGIYPSGTVPGQKPAIQRHSAPGANGTASFNTAGLAVGAYVAWYCYDNGDTTLDGPATFSVSP